MALIDVRTKSFGAARYALLWAALYWSAAAWAQPLKDPTQPPSAWLAAKAKAAAGDTKGSAVAVKGAKESVAVTPEVDPPQRLQSLLLGGPRNVALIDGQLVGVGDVIKNARVLSVGATEVVLLVGNTNRTLKLFPDVDQRIAQPALAADVLGAKPDLAPSRRIVKTEKK